MNAGLPGERHFHGTPLLVKAAMMTAKDLNSNTLFERGGGMGETVQVLEENKAAKNESFSGIGSNS